MTCARYAQKDGRREGIVQDLKRGARQFWIFGGSNEKVVTQRMLSTHEHIQKSTGPAPV